MIAEVDRSLFYILNQGAHNEVLDNLMVFITNYRFILFFLILVPFIIKDRKKGLFVLAIGIAGIIISSFSVSLLKLLFARLRPCITLEHVKLLSDCHESFSMPSGHAATAFTAAAIMGHFIRPAAIAAFILALLVGFSRIYVGVHYPADVIAGIIWGGVIAGGMLFLHSRISKTSN